jgi:membrane protein YdbS with pleckstrin-like domain
MKAAMGSQLSSVMDKIEEEKTAVTEPIVETPATAKVQTRLDLKQMFPQSARLAFEESFFYLLGLAVVTTGYIWASLQLPHVSDGNIVTDGTESILRSIFYVAVVIAGGKLLYEVVFFLAYRYTIELEHLTISRGVFFPSRASFPIAKINDVSLHRNPIEILFGLYNLTILTASPGNDYAAIEGLPKRSAYGLQTYLLALVETTLPAVRDKKADDILERSAVATRSAVAELAALRDNAEAPSP